MNAAHTTLKYNVYNLYVNRTDDRQYVLEGLHACVSLFCDRSAMSGFVCHAHEPLVVPESWLWLCFLICTFLLLSER